MIAWLNPGALVGLAVLAGPVLVHLLLRHRAARILFPSLRFVRASRTAAVRLRPPSDWLLLALRLATLGLAVLALAQPLLLAPARVAAWNARLARAVVVDVSAWRLRRSKNVNRHESLSNHSIRPRCVAKQP